MTTTDLPAAGPIRSRSELPPSFIKTLDGEAYVDAGFFAREQQMIFEEMWFCAAHESDLPDPGSFRTVLVGRESILLSRNRRGEVKAFFNVCRHRGARICTEDQGQVQRSFQCRYHAWTYDLDGKLIAAPNLTKMPDVNRIEYGLRTVHVERWLGYVWVCLAEQPPSFADTVQHEIVERLGTLAHLDAYATPELSIGRRIVYEVAANWKLIIENFMECYHCATIHPELTEVLPEFADGYAAQYYVNHGAEFGSGIEGFTVDGSPGLTRLPGLTGDQDRKYYAITVKPQVFINLVPDHVIVHRMYPLAADRTVVECDWLYLSDVVAAAERGEVGLDKSVELFDRVNRQDFEACERCQPAMSSRAYRDGGVLVPTEHHIGAFHGWLTDMVTAADAVQAEQDNPGARNPGSIDDPSASTVTDEQRAELREQQLVSPQADDQP